MATTHGGRRPGAGRKPHKVAKAKLNISDQAKPHGDAALKVLAEVMQDALSPPSARISAANALLDRGYGRPMQAVEMAGKDGGPIKTETGVSDDLKQALDAIANKVADGDGEGEVAGDSPADAGSPAG